MKIKGWHSVDAAIEGNFLFINDVDNMFRVVVRRIFDG
jgi:hypothetical protein